MRFHIPALFFFRYGHQFIIGYLDVFITGFTELAVGRVGRRSGAQLLGEKVENIDGLITNETPVCPGKNIAKKYVHTLSLPEILAGVMQLSPGAVSAMQAGL